MFLKFVRNQRETGYYLNDNKNVANELHSAESYRLPMKLDSSSFVPRTQYFPQCPLGFLDPKPSHCVILPLLNK